MKILITGSSGMLGTELCEVLESDHAVAGVDITSPQSTVHPVPEQVRYRTSGPRRFYEADITDAERIREVFDQEKPGMVIHAAAWTDVDGCEEDPEKAYTLNTTGTENVARAAAANAVPLIFLSTDFVFDGEKNQPYTEKDRTAPISVYGRTKEEAEKVVERSLEKYAIVRTSWLFGKNGRNFVDTIVNRGRSGNRIRVVNDQTGAPTYAKDLARAIKKLVDPAAILSGDIYHISNAGWCSWYDLSVRVLERVEGLAGTAVEPITSDEFKRPAKRPRFSVLDNSKFIRTTGFCMRPWEEAVDEYLSVRYGRVIGDQ
ncbi:MAG: dTDP-4-dehydrorhamnose reductase [Candidatus Omnitrophota bacterium]|nr:dTDP-4-dehydrorhamnose reductase [Candidatus Omnitrophota bacterium]